MFLLLMATCMLASCSLLDSEKKDAYSFRQGVAFQEVEDGPWGLVDLNGKVLVEPMFDSEPTMPSCDRFFVLSEDSLWELYTVEAQPQRVGNATYKDVGAFVDGLCPIVAPGSWPQYIDVNGKVVIDMKEYNGQRVVRAMNFQDGRARIMLENRLWGFIDEKGNMVIEPKYERTNDFFNGLSIVYKPLKKSEEESDQQWAIIDRDGKELFTTNKRKMKPELIGFEANGLTVVSKNYSSTYLLIDKNGKKVLTLDASEVQGTTGNHILYSDGDGHRGVMDTDGNVLIEPNYDVIRYYGGPIVAQNDDEDDTYFFLSDKGEVLNKIEADHIWIPSCDFMGYTDRLLCYIDTIETSLGYFADHKGHKLESSITFYEGGGKVMDYAMTDYELIDIFVSQFQLKEAGLLGVKMDSPASDFYKNRKAFLSGNEEDADRDNIFMYAGEEFGHNYNVGFVYDKPIIDESYEWNKDAKLTQIVMTLTVKGHSDELEAAVKKRIEGIATFKEEGSFGKCSGSVYKNDHVLIFFGTDDDGDVWVVYEQNTL